MTTVGTLTTRVRYRCDLAGQNVITDAEIRDYLSAAASWLLRELIATQGGGAYESSAVASVATTGVAALGSVPVSHVTAVVWSRSGYDDVSLQRTGNRGQRQAQEWTDTDPPKWWTYWSTIGANLNLAVDTPPTVATTVTVYYVPATVTFTSAADLNPLGNDDLLEVDAAIRCMHKEERPTQDLERERARLLGELRAAPRIDGGEPMQVPRKRTTQWWRL